MIDESELTCTTALAASIHVIGTHGRDADSGDEDLGLLLDDDIDELG